MPKNSQLQHVDQCLLESKPAALHLRVEVVVDETKESVDDKNDAIRHRDVGSFDARLYTVVTHIHCSRHRQTNQPSRNAPRHICHLRECMGETRVPIFGVGVPYFLILGLSHWRQIWLIFSCEYHKNHFHYARFNVSNAPKILILLGLCPTSHAESSQSYPGLTAGFAGMRVAARR